MAEGLAVIIAHIFYSTLVVDNYISYAYTRERGNDETNCKAYATHGQIGGGNRSKPSRMHHQFNSKYESDSR
jgi:hypothetical protein